MSITSGSMKHVNVTCTLHVPSILYLFQHTAPPWHFQDFKKIFLRKAHVSHYV